MHLALLLFASLVVAQTSASGGGIDVSHYNGDINWQRVKAAGIQFAMAKATEGNHFEDSKFVVNFNGMKSNGIKAGAYHYLRGGPTATSQVAKIRAVLQKVNFDPIRDVLAIDVEKGGNEKATADAMAETLNGVLDGLKSTYKNIYIYTGPYYWENEVSWRKFNFSQYNLWIAHYTPQSSPKIPTTWKNKGYTWWQFTDKGKVDGIKGNVDLNRIK
uniref:Lysozyme n=1 Tax=Graphocephala atropunctata TaxID=36148 RepID=A0A1B6LTI2_9HEMI